MILRKLVAVALIASFGLVFQNGCASLSVRDASGQVITTAETAKHLAVEAELAWRCGQPTALPAPNCISPEQHAHFVAILVQADKYLHDARDIWNLLPTTGSPDISAITQIIAKVAAIIQEIMNGIPNPAAQAKLAAAPEVVKTLAVKK